MTARSDAVAAAEGALGALVRRDVALGPLSTYRVGGAAALFAQPQDVAQLQRVGEAVHGLDLPLLVVGNGSNLLVSDAGFPGLAVQLGDGFNRVEVEATVVRAGGGALLPVVARRSVAASLTGFEWAVGVPGSIGGAVRMNAGGHGSDMAAHLDRVRVLDIRTGEDGEVPAGELDLGYRQSAVRASQVVVRADLQLARGDRSRSEAELAEVVRWRRTHQPGGANAGSVFTNPPGDSAGRLIEEAGAKGLRIGSAHVSTKHSNFIQADEGGRADDVYALMVEVARLVRDRTGVALQAETRLVGYEPVGEAGLDGPTRTSR